MADRPHPPPPPVPPSTISQTHHVVSSCHVTFVTALAMYVWDYLYLLEVPTTLNPPRSLQPVKCQLRTYRIAPHVGGGLYFQDLRPAIGNYEDNVG